MSGIHIMQSIAEIVMVLLAAYAIYRADDIVAFWRQFVRAARYHRHRRKRLRRAAKREAAVQFNTRDHFSIEIKEEQS